MSIDLFGERHGTGMSYNYLIYKELNHIGGNINQIAYIANSERHITNDKINEVAKLMNDIWRCVRSYGRNA